MCFDVKANSENRVGFFWGGGGEEISALNYGASVEI